MEKEICNEEKTQRVCKGTGRTKEGPRSPERRDQLRSRRGQENQERYQGKAGSGEE
jgi:hypothetical protein